MSFSFSALGAQPQTAEQLAEENANSSFDFMPPQKNNVFVIDKVEFKESASGAAGLNFQFACVGEKYANRKVFNYVNVVKKDGTLNEISYHQIGALAFAVGHTGVIDNPVETLEQYVGVPFVADVIITQQEGYNPQNQLANWKPNKGQPFSEKAIPAKFKGEQQGGLQPAQQQGFQPQNQGFQPQSQGFQPQQPQQGFQPQQQPAQPQQPVQFDSMPAFAQQPK